MLIFVKLGMWHQMFYIDALSKWTLYFVIIVNRFRCGSIARDIKCLYNETQILQGNGMARMMDSCLEGLKR